MKICTDLLYQPLTLLDCLHTFCGSCLKEWFSWQRRNATATQDDNHRRGRKVRHTCPACRARVRDTKVDAKVNTLLEVLLQLDPSKSKSEEEKRRISETYRPGEPVLRTHRSSNDGATPRPAMVDEQSISERLAQLGLGDATNIFESGSDVAGPSQQSRHRPSSQRSNRRRDSPGPSHERLSLAANHQPSLVSLLSGSDNASISEGDLYRHAIEGGYLRRIARGMTPEEEEDLSRQIAEDYQHRRRSRTRHERHPDNEQSSHEPESGASIRRAERNRRPLFEPPPLSRVWQSNEPTRLRSASRHRSSSRSIIDDGRPVSRESAHRPRTSSSQRVGRPDSSHDAVSRRSSRHHENSPVQDFRPNRPEPTLESIARLPSRHGEDVPVSPVQERTDHRRHNHRHGTSVSSSRPSSGRSGDAAHGHHRRARHHQHQHHHRHHYPRNLSETPPSTARSSQLRVSSESRQYRQPSQDGRMSRPGSAAATDFQLQRSTRPLLQFEEPHLTCAACGKCDIQYEVHRVCYLCFGNRWTVCNRCYLQGSVCKHWYGFGTDAQLRYEQARRTRPLLPPPHVILARKYRQPPENSILGDMTSSDPATRLDEGLFCSMCNAFADECYWKCEQCNDGEWGFCNNCVNQGRCCTHHLLPIAKIYDDTFPEEATPKPVLEFTLGHRYSPLSITTSCNLCRCTILKEESYFHCPECEDGDYDICHMCYTRPRSSVRMSREDGHEGWRRCFQGHRMIVVGYHLGEMGYRRIILQDVVGGHALREDFTSGEPSGSWSWLETSDVSNSGRRVKALRRRHGMRVIAQPVHNSRFPPSGGVGLRVLALWSYYPEPDVKDEICFPRRAEITEAENINNDWYWGCYAGQRGLFPGLGYVRVLEEVTNLD